MLLRNRRRQLYQQSIPDRLLDAGRLAHCEGSVWRGRPNARRQSALAKAVAPAERREKVAGAVIGTLNEHCRYLGNQLKIARHCMSESLTRGWRLALKCTGSRLLGWDNQRSAREAGGHPATGTNRNTANCLDRLPAVARMNNEEYRRNQHSAAAGGISGVLDTGQAETG